MPTELYDLIGLWIKENNVPFERFQDHKGREAFRPINPSHYHMDARMAIGWYNNKDVVIAHFDNNTTEPKCHLEVLDPCAPDFFDKMREFLICSCSSVGRAGLSKSLDTGSTPVRSAKI